MRQLLLLGVLACSIFFAGCPLQTDEPILSDPETQIPSWIPGTWVELKQGQESLNVYRVESIPTAPLELKITGLDTANRADKDDTRKAFISYVGRQLFVSAYDKGDEDNEAGYYHYAIAQNPKGEAFLVPVQEELLAMNTTGADLASYFRDHAATSDYLDRGKMLIFRKKLEESKK